MIIWKNEFLRLPSYDCVLVVYKTDTMAQRAESSGCLNESPYDLAVLLLRERPAGLRGDAPLGRHREERSGHGTFVGRFADGDHVIAAGHHIKVLHPHTGTLETLAGGI